MREIKFRAKDFKGNWVYGTYAYGVFYPDSYKTHRIFPSNTEIDEETLGEFVGLTDRNGKEIYEGDIIKGATDIFDKFTGQVSYAGCSYVIDGVGKYKRIREELNNSYEVIGNIYENPELINS